MNLYSVLFTVVVLAACAYFGVLRPTGLASRTRAEREEDERRDVASKWLKQDDERK